MDIGREVSLDDISFTRHPSGRVVNELVDWAEADKVSVAGIERGLT